MLCQASSHDLVSESDANMATKDLLMSLLLIASSSGRGEFATTSQKDQALSLIEHLEKSIRGRIYHDSVRKICGPIRGDFFN